MDAARRSALARVGTDRLLILTSLGLLTLLAWAYLYLLAARMDRGDMSLMGSFGLMALMWWVMMIGMMIPSALPTILLHARVQRHHRSDAGEVSRLALLFAAGYLVTWAGFSLVATTTQRALTMLGWLAAMTMSAGHVLGAVLFAIAGFYQMSTLKYACLKHCRSPAEFLSSHHRPGSFGALVTGAHHGLYCVGCCWLLMALLFAGGVMNILWVVALAALVLLEKLLPQGQWVARVSGVLMVAFAAYLLVSA